MVKGSERELNKIKLEPTDRIAHWLNDQSREADRQWVSGSTINTNHQDDRGPEAMLRSSETEGWL